MSSQKNIALDYMWVRHAPIEEGLKVKNFGQYHQYDNAPNSLERLEMTYRTMGKAYDWELEKFRLGKKPIDRGNKRRFFRNVYKFVKNPIAYWYWAKLANSKAVPRSILTIFLFGFAGTLLSYVASTRRIQQHDNYLLNAGKNIEGMSGRYIGYHDQKTLTSPDIFQAIMRVNFEDSMVEINPTWRQNIRKQLHLTNAHGVVF